MRKSSLGQLTASRVGQDFDLGGITVSNFQPQYILFYRLKVIRNGSADPNSWTYQYPVYGLYDSVDIAQFIDMALSDDLPPMTATKDDPLAAANITVTDPCYVVLQLTSDDGTMRFRDNHEAIKTSDDHRSQYRRLSHVDAAGNIHINTSTTNCNLVYFAVKSIALTDQDHSYNIYVQYTDGGTIVPKEIDPAIKNRGGDDATTVVALRKTKQPKAAPSVPVTNGAATNGAATHRPA